MMKNSDHQYCRSAESDCVGSMCGECDSQDFVPVRIYRFEDVRRSSQFAKIVAEQRFHDDPGDHHFSQPKRVIIKTPAGEVTTWDVAIEPTISVDASEVRG